MFLNVYLQCSFDFFSYLLVTNIIFKDNRRVKGQD